VLTFAKNIIQLQKQLKGVAKQHFGFHNNKSGTRVITKDMVEYQSVKAHFESNNVSYYTFYPKSERPIKAMLHHLSVNTLEEETAVWLVDLRFEVISVRQVLTTRRSL
jgi:hypothetical protein